MSEIATRVLDVIGRIGHLDDDSVSTLTRAVSGLSEMHGNDSDVEQHKFMVTARSHIFTSVLSRSGRNSLVGTDDTM